MTVEFKDRSNVVTPSYYETGSFTAVTRSGLYLTTLYGDNFVYTPRGAVRVSFRLLGKHTIYILLKTSSAAFVAATPVEGTDYYGMTINVTNTTSLAHSASPFGGWYRIEVDVENVDNSLDIGKFFNSTSTTMTGYIAYNYRDPLAQVV